MNRRNLLKGAGIVTVVAAGGLVWRAIDRGVFRVGQGPAFEPWNDWKSESGPHALGLVRAAILAASPHNTQPWIFRVSEGRIELYADTARNLGMFDPYLREMHIGLGCAVENMMLAAVPLGYKLKSSLVSSRLGPIPSKAEGGMVFAIDLEPASPGKSSLYDAIPYRHTNRAAYDMARPISAAMVNSLEALSKEDDDVRLFLLQEEQLRKRAGEILVQATQTIVSDAQMQADSEHWIRNTPQEIQQFRDGLSLDCMGLSRGMNALAKIGPPLSPESKGRFWLEQTRSVHAAKTGLFGLIAVRDRLDSVQNLKAGRLWQRLHLWATAGGLAAQPTNQPVEVVDREQILNQTPRRLEILGDPTGDTSWQPTFMFRMGYPTQTVPPSPRRSLRDVLL